MSVNNLQQIDKRLTDGLAKGSVVLFFGPELIKFDGQDFNLSFYGSLPDDGPGVTRKNAKYDEKEKIWNFESVRVKREFYSLFDEYFKQHRDNHNPLFFKLASIPFPLIISLLPDDLIYAAFKKYGNFNYSFKSLLDKEFAEPTKDNMLIYNIYGNIENQEYVASHFDYLNFIINYGKTYALPVNLKSAINKANYLIFVGCEFDKWYNIMLLYILNEIKQGQQKYAVEDQSVEELVQKLSDSSLNLMFIKENCEEFIDELYQKSVELNIARKPVPTREILMEQISSKQDIVEETKMRIQVTAEPLEKKRLEMDVKTMEDAIEELKNQLKNLPL